MEKYEQMQIGELYENTKGLFIQYNLNEDWRYVENGLLVMFLGFHDNRAVFYCLASEGKILMRYKENTRFNNHFKRLSA